MNQITKSNIQNTVGLIMPHKVKKNGGITIEHTKIGLPGGWSLAPNYHLIKPDGTDLGLVLQETGEEKGLANVKCIVPGCSHINEIGKDSVSRMRRKAEEFHLGEYKKKLMLARCLWLDCGLLWAVGPNTNFPVRARCD